MKINNLDDPEFHYQTGEYPKIGDLIYFEMCKKLNCPPHKVTHIEHRKEKDYWSDEVDEYLAVTVESEPRPIRASRLQLCKDK